MDMRTSYLYIYTFFVLVAVKTYFLVNGSRVSMSTARVNPSALSISAGVRSGDLDTMIMDVLVVQVFGMMAAVVMSQHNATHPPWK